ncbi:MAG: hypothetical protein JWN99_614 [Ilumatobacteraceae bacterium]|nr:hypothetical protein [Ilumatobacteraceae bacterium]
MNTPARVLHATLDLLDRQLLDRNKMACGNVDDVELTVKDDGKLYVTALLTGPGILSYRLRRKRLGLWLQEADRRLHGDVDDDRDRSRIPIELAFKIGPAITVAMDAADIASQDLERWARDHFADRIPGGRDAPE